MGYKVSEIATSAGVSPDTVRYYEREGLLPEPERSAAGHRVYEAEVIDRLRFIKGAQRFGLRLREIRDLLDIRDRGLCPCGHTGDLLKQRVVEVEEELKRLERLRSDLRDMAARYPLQCDVPGPGGWPCEVEFMNVGGEADG